MNIVRKISKRQWALFVTMITTIISLFAVITTIVYASSDFFSFNIDRDILKWIFSAAVAVFVGVFFSMFFQLLKRK